MAVPGPHPQGGWHRTQRLGAASGPSLAIMLLVLSFPLSSHHLQWPLAPHRSDHFPSSTSLHSFRMESCWSADRPGSCPLFLEGTMAFPTQDAHLLSSAPAKVVGTFKVSSKPTSPTFLVLVVGSDHSFNS